MFDPKKIKNIKTHARRAHRDDYTAVSMLLYACSESEDSLVPVERVSYVQPFDISDPTVAVVDTGAIYDEAMSCFDHHTWDGPPSSVGLVAKALGIYDVLEMLDWFRASEVLDTEGPDGLARYVGAEVRQISKLISIVEKFHLEMFEAEDELTYRQMYRFGKYIVEYAQGLNEGRKKLKEVAEIKVAGRTRGIVCTDPSIDYETINKHKESLEPGKGRISWCITPDIQTKGWSVYRYSPHELGSFEGLRGLGSVVYAGECLVRTRSVELEEVLALIAEAETQDSDLSGSASTKAESP